MGFHHLIDELGNTYSSFTVEFIAADSYLEPGWYWTPYTPRGQQEPNGPFKTQGDAMRDAGKVQ